MINAILWIVAASLAGFGIAALSADLLKLRRNVFLLLYVPAVAILFCLSATARWNNQALLSNSL